MDLIDRRRRDIDCRLEAECKVRAIDIIIDCLRKMDNIQSLFTEQVCRLLCAVAAENDEAVETKLVIILLHGLDLVESVRIRYAHELERLAGRADDRAAACQNAREISSSQQAVIAVNEPLVAVLKAVNLEVLDIVAQSFDDAAHRCVQCLAVAPACQ